MRKRIAVFLGEVGREFQKDISQFLKNIANDKGYDVFIFNNFGSYASTTIYDIGERDVITIPDLSTFEGIIMIPDTFDIDGMEEKLMARIKREATCPVVSIRNGPKETHRIVIDDYQTSYNLTEHFIKQHGYRKICYMSGPKGVEDSENRLNGFLAAMAHNGIPTEGVIFEGDFWKFKSKEATDFFLQTYDGKPQAIMFANDFMALGVCEELKARGINVPGDIAICGYDDCVEGRAYHPALTTVRMPIKKMAENAIAIIEDANMGKEVPDEIALKGDILLKSSCGCFVDSMRLDLSYLLSQVYGSYINIRSSTFLTADIRNHITEDEKLLFVNEFTKRFSFKKSFLCLCTDDYIDDNPYSETMRLRAVFPLENDINSTLTEKSLFKRSLILPEELNSPEPTCYIVLPIHHKNTTYGYLVTEWVDNEYTTNFIAPYVEAIAMAYDDLRMQEEYSELLEIRRQNLIDPLTGILNRRGFESRLAALKTSKDLGTEYLSFISIDLDNLKIINDTYGHFEGDSAIVGFAEVLQNVTGPNDVCSRVGGDEYYLILTSPDKNAHDTFIDRVTEELRAFNERTDNGYGLHASIGIHTVDSSDRMNALEYIQIADRKMYEAKRNYKMSLEGN